MIKQIIWILLFSLMLDLNTVFSQQGWYQQFSFTSNYLYCVNFVSTGTGWVCGQNGTILKTTNGGINWLSQQSNTTGFLYTIFFIDQNTGWTAGQNGSIRKTTNSGTNWQTLTSNFASYIYSLTFTDVNTGYFAGANGTIYKSTDGGSSWVQKSIGVSGTLSCIHFPASATSTIGYISGGTATEGIILKTSNAGENWAQMPGTGSNWLFGIFFIDLINGWAGGINGAMLYTSNGGANWITQTSGTTNRIVQLCFANQNTGWAVGYAGTIVYTSNGGANWSAQVSNTNQNLWGVDFFDASTGWAAGWNGEIVHTTTGGLTSVKPISSEIPIVCSLSQNYPNPFNPKTVIQFQTSDFGFVNIEIYNIIGKNIETIVDEYLSPGTYEVEFDGTSYSSGVYYYVFTAHNFIQTKKMILAK